MTVMSLPPRRRAAAVHRRVADADDEDLAADRLDVAEGDGLQPVDPDVDVRVADLVPAPGEVELLASGGSAADEDGVEALVEHGLHAGDGGVVADVDPHVEDHLGLLVEHLGGQAEGRDVGPHQAARHSVLLEHGDGVAQWEQVVRHGERRRAGADAGDALVVRLLRGPGQPVADVTPQVGSDALEAADGHRRTVDPLASAGRLARAVAGPTEDRREDVRLPVHQVGVVVPALGDEADVLRHVGVGRAGPLAVHYLVVVARIFDVRRFHVCIFPIAPRDGKTSNCVSSLLTGTCSSANALSRWARGQGRRSDPVGLDAHELRCAVHKQAGRVPAAP
jgi:hypothetical protein